MSAEDWNWLFEEDGSLLWQATIPDFAVICRVPASEGQPARFSVLNVQTGDQAQHTDLLKLLSAVVPEVEDWPGLMDALKADKLEDPFDRLEAIAATLEQKGWANRPECDAAARRIRAAVRRIQAMPRRARVSDARVNQAAIQLVKAIHLPEQDIPAVAGILRQVLG